MQSYDDDREVRFDDDDAPIIPDQTSDEGADSLNASRPGLGAFVDEGRGQRWGSNDARLLEERPPHWD